MTLVLLIIVIAIIGYFAANIYRHDNTTFYKITGYSYLDVLTNKDVRTTFHLVNALNIAKGAHKILVNVQVPVNGDLQQIDALLIHESGIYVMKHKDMTGWINGREQDLQWMQLLHRDQSRLFENPIHDVKRLNYALQDQLPEVSDEAFNSLVVFSNACSFQQVELHSADIDVVKVSELKKWTGTLAGKRLTETEIETLYAAIEPMMNVKSSELKLKNSIA
jgi:hypothetical protein